MLLGFLRVWGIEKVVDIDALMSPTEEYFDAIYFQVAVSSLISMLNIMYSFLSFSCFSSSSQNSNLLYKYYDVNMSSPEKCFHFNRVAVVHSDRSM